MVSACSRAYIEDARVDGDDEADALVLVLDQREGCQARLLAVARLHVVADLHLQTHPHRHTRTTGSVLVLDSDLPPSDKALGMC